MEFKYLYIKIYKIMSRISKKIKISRSSLIILLLAVICLFLVLEIFDLHLIRKDEGKFAKDHCEEGYSFINPRFACGYENKIDKKGYSELKSRLNDFIEEKKDEKKAKIVAVWFRDLEGGPTFGINDREDFIPASLLKLPLVLTFFQLAEDDPQLLKRTIVYSDTTSSVLNQTFIPQDNLVKGTAYTIEDLIFYAIANSDNMASQLLYEYVKINYKDEPLSQIYRDLGILEPGTDVNMAAVNTKEYGSIFRMLYNVSFLGRDASEKLLSLLSQSDFQDGLSKGVPGYVNIAHKFGERFLDNGQKQLHDCGIIYYPDNPYQLCIMTRGSDFNDLSQIIGEVSKEVYLEFDSRRMPPPGGGD
ncbi:MAG: hypothetical protein A3B91_04600 [Candidatus Yanofskybacteria bacterium RIFCSPHIGHO2_02_FULL_41_29]|nr:MAG: hypothetical protein A3B91_04600 [Candidatus Yanofskybacteria bacterium RIFCSPHIGHO2_02_FULL_41_29]